MEANGKYSFTMLFEPAEEGGYVVTCPALPGLVTEGDTMEEARRMAQDALRGYLESLIEDGLTIPPDKPPITEPVEIALAS
jgi:antitoxin HicB